MYKTREEFISALGVSKMPELFGARFDESMALYDRDGVFFLEDEFIAKLQEKYNIFKEKYDFVIASAKRVRENEFLARYSLLLYHMLCDKDPDALLYLKEAPKAEEEPLKTDYEMAAFFTHLALTPQVVEYYRAHRVPDEIIRDTLNDYLEGAILVCNDYQRRDGYEVMRSFNWNQLFVNCKCIRVGVLNFEMSKCVPTKNIKAFKNKSGEYKILINGRDISASGYISGTAGHEDIAYHAEISESDDAFEGYEVDTLNARATGEKIRLDKREWRLVLTPEDNVIDVHIPIGVELTVPNMEAAYERAVKIFAECFPEFKPKAFVCFSWLMDPQLREMLNPESKIIAFQSKFLRFPMKANGDGACIFLFKNTLRKKYDIPALAEDTSLQRKVKRHYLDGKYIYDHGGVFFEYLEV